MGASTVLSWDRPWSRGRTAALLLLMLLPNQLLWLIPTNYFLAGLSGAFIRELTIALFLSHTCRAFVVGPLQEPPRRWLA